MKERKVISGKLRLKGGLGLFYTIEGERGREGGREGERERKGDDVNGMLGRDAWPGCLYLASIGGGKSHSSWGILAHGA